MIDLHKGPQEMSDAEWLQATGVYIFGNRGWQTALGKEIGLSQQFISNVVNGRRALTSEHRAKLATVCSEWLNDTARRRKQIEMMEKYWRDTAESNFRPPINRTD